VTGVAAASREAGFQEMGLSFGAATWAAGKQATALIEEADRAMFASKPASGTATSTGEA
jgi:GGDEF domain-containing protein